MPDLLQKTPEEEQLDEYVMMAGIIIKNEKFQPLPPKSPKESEKVSQIHEEEEDEQPPNNESE